MSHYCMFCGRPIAGDSEHAHCTSTRNQQLAKIANIKPHNPPTLPANQPIPGSSNVVPIAKTTTQIVQELYAKVQLLELTINKLETIIQNYVSKPSNPGP